MSCSINGTSTLQLQIGFFRLLQGAAYRSFRESFSANSETHLRAYDLPYSIRDFVLIPLLEINGTLKDPETGILVSDFLLKIKKNQSIKKMEF